MISEYRKNVAIVIFNKEKKVLMCERIDFENQWQFPQGGIDEGETPQTAAIRELFEETSIKSAKLIYTTSDCISYDFPLDVQQKFQSKGQEQYWSLFYFTGNDDEINLKTKQPEFKSYKWIDIKKAPLQIIDFKKEAYQKAVNLLEPMINAYKA
ncbi:MAG: RNA pyrophosphohydrolase [Alphaproteobacteria bacterium]